MKIKCHFMNIILILSDKGNKTTGSQIRDIASNNLYKEDLPK